jgi:hypothetical protein
MMKKRFFGILFLLAGFIFAVSCSSAGEDGDVNNSGNSNTGSNGGNNSSGGVSFYVAEGMSTMKMIMKLKDTVTGKTESFITFRFLQVLALALI